MNRFSIRLFNIAGFFACAGMMAYALYAEHILMLMPCPLCVFQRVAVIILGLIFLVIAIHDSRKIIFSWCYVAMITLVAGSGIGVAGRHVWLQNLPLDEVPSCGPGFDYIIDSFPLSEALSLIFTGSGECASTDWQLIGFSMPAWVLISLVCIAVLGIWNNLRNIFKELDS